MILSKKINFVSLLFIALMLISIESCKNRSFPTEPVGTVLNDDTISKLQAAADKVMFSTPGLVAYIAVEGEGDLYITRGVSNLSTSEPMSSNNYFRIASITKTFTTEAVLILADEGLIDLNKSVSSYLPDYKIPGGNNITIRMLGNMTSGLFDYLQDESFMMPFYQSSGTKVMKPDSMLSTACRHPLNFTPGTRYEYCNTNTVTLGLVIAKVTGKPVGQVLSERIFQPLGMTHTYWPSSCYLPYPYTHGYSTELSPGLQDVTNWSPSQGDAAGILISNICDLKIWLKEVYEGNLLSASSKSERFKWVDEDGTGTLFYGYGLKKVRDWIGHSGVIDGYNSQVYYNPVKKISIIVNTNTQVNVPAEWAFSFFAAVLAP